MALPLLSLDSSEEEVNKVTRKFIELVDSLKKHKFGNKGKKCQNRGEEMKFKESG